MTRLGSGTSLFSGDLTTVPMTTLTFTTNNFDTQFNFEATRQGSAWRLRSVTFDSALGVPEPGTLALMGAGLIGLALWRRRRHAPSHGPADNRLGEIVSAFAKTFA